jgi:hypothetical protein
MHRTSSSATSGLLALSVVIAMIIAVVVIVAPALHALSETIAALAAILH